MRIILVRKIGRIQHVESLRHPIPRHRIRRETAKRIREIDGIPGFLEPVESLAELEHVLSDGGFEFGQGGRGEVAGNGFTSHAV